MSTLRQRLHSDGFADLGLMDPSRPSAEIASEVAASINAVVVAAPEQLEVSPRGTKGLNTYGGNYGLDALPFHTDLQIHLMQSSFRCNCSICRRTRF